MDGGLRQLFRKHLPQAHWQPIETGLTGRGVPDGNYCCNGVEGWVEFKKANGWKVTVRPEQVAWAERRSRAGGRVFLAARKGGSLYLMKVTAFRHLATKGNTLNGHPKAIILGIWHGGPALWDWGQVAKCLFSRP